MAVVVLAALHEDGRDQDRVYAVRRSLRDEVETAALELVPEVGSASRSAVPAPARLLPPTTERVSCAGAGRGV